MSGESGLVQHGRPCIEVGPKDVANAACVLARRDRPGKEGKERGVPVEAVSLAAKVHGVLGEVQASLLQEATAFRDANIVVGG